MKTLDITINTDRFYFEKPVKKKLTLKLLKVTFVIFILACMTLIMPSCLVYGGNGYQHHHDFDDHQDDQNYFYDYK